MKKIIENPLTNKGKSIILALPKGKSPDGTSTLTTENAKQENAQRLDENLLLMDRKKEDLNMSNYYNLDGVKTYLARTLDEKESLLAAWKAVTFNTKKDGSPFAALAKNFNNARIGRECYDTREYEKRLYVVAMPTRLNGYMSDSIKLWEDTYYFPDNDCRLMKTEKIIDIGVKGHDQYIYDVEDVKTAIAKRIAVLAKECEELRKEIARAETVYNNFKAAYKQAMDTLILDTREFDSKALYYAVLETIKERYPYC